MKDKIKRILKEVYPYVLIIVIVVLIRTYIITPVVVSGNSMVPNLNDGELLLVRKIGYDIDSITRFDIIVLKDGDEEIIKRVIGLPGDHISYKNNKLYVNDQLINEPYLFRNTDDFNLEEICTCNMIPKGKLLVLGDNRPVSKDSRQIGLINDDAIVGKAIFRIWPFNKIGDI